MKPPCSVRKANWLAAAFVEYVGRSWAANKGRPGQLQLIELMARSDPHPAALAQAVAEALALHQQGRLDEAEKLYARVLKAKRDHFDALHLLGMLNHQRGRAGEAFRLISAALKVDPRSADALSNLALVLHALKRDDEALASLGRALALAPGHADAITNRGNILLDLGRPADAVADFDAVLMAAPRHVQARINHGNALAMLGQNERAIADYDAALATAPGHPLALYNRGNALRALGCEAEAVADYDRALAAVPNHVNAWLNRGQALAALNRHQEALASYGKALALRPDYADAHFNAALSLLTLGDYARGFAEYEWRWKRTGMTTRSDFGNPLWLGETPLAGRTILLHAEQGLGDTVQFVRYAPLIARAGAQVVLEVQSALKPLLAGIEGVSATIARGESLPPFDLHCPLASLPLACKTDLANIPTEIPYLRAPAERLAQWRPRLEALPSPRVALAWAGQVSHPNDRNRSIALSQLAPLLETPGLRFVSIQRELRPGDAELLAREGRIAHLGNELADFADTAAVLALVDFVICVDTAVAHVAGALSRPAFVLLPFQPDWRWMLERERSPWYPAMTLFRQPAIGDWASVIARVRAALAAGLPNA
jgi:tetratricopeptide (TPR) repeat protein